MRVVHRFVSPKLEQADPTLVGPNEWNDTHELLDNVFLFNQDFNFTAQNPGGVLTVGSNAITLIPVPLGVNGTDGNHYLCIHDPNGSFEAVPITGGNAIAGSNSGTIIINATRTHPAGWSIQSATAGIQEAYQNLIDRNMNGPIFINNMNNLMCAGAIIDRPNITIRGFSWGSFIKAADNARIVGGLIRTTENATGFELRDCTLDGNAQNYGTWKPSDFSVPTCLMISSGDTTIDGCLIRFGYRLGIFIGSSINSPTNISISRCFIQYNGGPIGHGHGGSQSGYAGVGIFFGGTAPPKNIRIINNMLLHNHNQDTEPGDGTGIFGDAREVLVMGNYFQDNFNAGGGQVGCAVTTSPGVSNVEARWSVVGNVITCSGSWGNDHTDGVEIACRDFIVSGNIIHWHTTGAGINIDGNQTGNGIITGNTISHCQQGIISNPLPGGSIDHLIISDNSIDADLFGIALSLTHDFISIRGNNIRGGSQDIAGYEGSSNEITNNNLSRPTGLENVPMTGSPMTYTAGSSREQISIFGATDLSAQIQGSYVVASGVTSLTYMLNPNHTLIINYTGNPTMIIYKMS